MSYCSCCVSSSNMGPRTCFSLRFRILLLLALTFSLDLAMATPKCPPHFTFYLHNKLLDTSPSVNNTHDFNSVATVQPTGFPSPSGFGTLVTFEDPLTYATSNVSERVGVAQGFFMLDSETSEVEFMVFTAVINTTDYEGSLQIFGQNKVSLLKRVLSVIGGTGDFFLARGLATCELIQLHGSPGPVFWTLYFELDLYY